MGFILSPFHHQTGRISAVRHFLKLLVILAMVAAPLAAGAQDLRINPVPPGSKPRWSKVPGAPQVSWAPNLPTDVFRFRGKYYFFWENFFYQGPRPQGPWKAVTKVPEVFYQVGPGYFKTAKKPGRTPAAPAAPGESLTPPKARIIDIPPAPAPQPEPVPPGSPEAPPKVM
jgi:hypothetical protein